MMTMLIIIMPTAIHYHIIVPSAATALWLYYGQGNDTASGSTRLHIFRSALDAIAEEPQIRSWLHETIDLSCGRRVNVDYGVLLYSNAVYSIYGWNVNELIRQSYASSRMCWIKKLSSNPWWLVSNEATSSSTTCGVRSSSSSPADLKSFPFVNETNIDNAFSGLFMGTMWPAPSTYIESTIMIIMLSLLIVPITWCCLWYYISSYLQIRQRSCRFKASSNLWVNFPFV